MVYKFAIKNKTNAELNYHTWYKKYLDYLFISREEFCNTSQDISIQKDKNVFIIKVTSLTTKWIHINTVGNSFVCIIWFPRNWFMIYEDFPRNFDLLRK